MAKNAYGQTYEGNDDFRGWLAGNGYGQFLPYTGNDGGVNTNDLQKTLYGTGNHLGGLATDIRSAQSAANNDSNSMRMEYYPSVISGLYKQWSSGRKAVKGGNEENTYNPYGTGGGGSSVNQETVSQLDQSASMIQKALGRLDNQFGIAKGNITKQYGQYENELNSQRAANENNYKTSTTQNQQGFRTNKNTINDQASQGLRGLQRLLGSYGAVGSDMGLAGRAVADVASAQNAGAGQNYSQNQQSLDTNWGNYRNQWENEREKAVDWRDQQINQAEAQSKTGRQDLLSQLADIQGRLSQARGGQYTDGAQSYLDKANSLSSRIDELGRINPRYDGKTPVYKAPELSTYRTENPATAQLQERATGGLNTPFLNMLLGRDDREKKLMY